MADTRENQVPEIVEEAIVRAEDLSQESAGLRWYQGVPRYAWLVLAIAALGWLFDTMDQHLFNLVRQTSITELLKGQVAPALLDARAKEVAANVTAVILIRWA